MRIKYDPNKCKTCKNIKFFCIIADPRNGTRCPPHKNCIICKYFRIICDTCNYEPYNDNDHNIFF